MRILHLSDLHVVAKETSDLVNVFNAEMAGQPFKLQVHPAHADGRKILAETLELRSQTSPFDAVVVTGDLTGFGDDKSMAIAAEYLKHIADTVLIEKGNYKKIVVLPGNHDVLEYTTTAFLQTVENEIGTAKSFLFRFFGSDIGRLSSGLKKLLKGLRPEGSFPIGPDQVVDFGKYLKATFNFRFNDFTIPELDGSTSFDITGQAADGQEVDVCIVLINTLTFLPILFSSGMLSEVDAAMLSLRLSRARNSATIALTHQGLLPLPTSFLRGLRHPEERDIAIIFEHSFASLINGSNLARVLQNNNVELHLHGHEHYHTSSGFDFELNKPGALYSFGTAAGGQIDGADFGFQVVRFETPDVVQVESHEFVKVRATFDQSDSQIIMLGDVVPERSTRIARNELYRVFYNTKVENLRNAEMSIDDFKRACDDLFETSDKKLLYFGVQLRKARVAIQRCLHNGTPEKKRLYKERLLMGVNFLITQSTHLYPGRDRAGGTDEHILADWAPFFSEVAQALDIDEVEVQKIICVKRTTVPLAHGGIIEYSEPTPGHFVYNRALIQTVRFQDAFDSDIYFEVREHVTAGLLNYYAGTAISLWRENSKSVGERSGR